MNVSCSDKMNDIFVPIQRQDLDSPILMLAKAISMGFSCTWNNFKSNYVLPNLARVDLLREEQVHLFYKDMIDRF